MKKLLLVLAIVASASSAYAWHHGKSQANQCPGGPTGAFDYSTACNLISHFAFGL